MTHLAYEAISYVFITPPHQTRHRPLFSFLIGETPHTPCRIIKQPCMHARLLALSTM
jgi:hypothetical protein